jgi:hypothetical protein
MSDLPCENAWNNFVMSSEPADYPLGSIKWHAAIAKMYMSQANGGGLNSFLTNSYEIDASDVVKALETVGALKAVEQLSLVLRGMGVSLPVSSQEARWKLMELHWPDALNDIDILSDESDKDLMQALERHVLQYEQFYLALA